MASNETLVCQSFPLTRIFRCQLGYFVTDDLDHPNVRHVNDVTSSAIFREEACQDHVGDVKNLRDRIRPLS